MPSSRRVRSRDEQLLVARRAGGRSGAIAGLPALGNAALQRVLTHEADPRALSSSLALSLQSSLGNRATRQILRGPRVPRLHIATTPAPEQVIHRCGGQSPDSCGCHAVSSKSAAVSRSLTLQRQIGGNVAPGASGETEAVQPCGVGDRLLAFTTWAMATAKLAENIPFLELAARTGIRSYNYKRKLLRHFGVSMRDRALGINMARTLADGYRQILSTMAGGIDNVSCGGTQCRPGDYAYVYPGTPINVFFCDTQRSVKNLFKDPWDLASTWVHEISHEVLGTNDVEYYNHKGTTTLNPTAALTNADCWGNFMVEY
jgi:hypothetical protein